MIGLQVSNRSLWPLVPTAKTTRDSNSAQSKEHCGTWFWYGGKEGDVVAVTGLVGDEQVVTPKGAEQRALIESVKLPGQQSSNVGNQVFLIEAQLMLVDQRNTELTPTRAVFEGPRHDYLKRIVYELSADGGLSATIGFTKGGTPPPLRVQARGN